ncbi:asparaginase domain-containing protein [Treponema brennaborense]|uniref:Asn/Gln amidotransferase n=1 Tax=Treponema brennaborense (strain DSM 12168 / CIP 105900 / DD5/3) TaxID=906968 RepID=F4LMJ4_TREBD|nr:asparaginase domain-containing protein [Treponema brennaborense]AEE15756.1 Asn/Gln amidotransferase [Treponema brennaborense DSM 12168]
MYQSHVYLEARILLSAADTVFSDEGKPCVTAPGILETVCLLAGTLSCSFPEKARFERLTGALPESESRRLTGLSLKVAENGRLEIEFHHRKKSVHIEEVRLEEDAGRLTRSEGKTRMDYTYAGYPSVRIKTGADFELGEEAELFLNELRRLIQYLGISGDIQIETAIRCNAYAALARYPEIPTYYVKLRNLNSFNFVRKAINSELDRQESVLTGGGTVASESRLWNERQNITESYKQRSRQDVRRFEPVTPAAYETIPAAGSVPCELPEPRRRRLCAEYSVSRIDADFICDEKERADFFEEAVRLGADPVAAAHIMNADLVRLLKRQNLSISQNPVSAARFASIVQLFVAHRIHGGLVKQLIQNIIDTDKDPEEAVERKGFAQISSEEELLPLIRKVITANPAEAEKLRAGDMAPLEFLTGLIMKRTAGRASPQTVKYLFKRELHISIVYVLSAGGAISARRRPDGSISAEDGQVLRELFAQSVPDVRVQVVPVGRLFSEEMEPADFAPLIAEIAERIAAGIATGIVVAHGKDTLPYTAALLFWLFSDAAVPVVLTASAALPEDSDEARRNLTLAAETAVREKSGVYVVFGGKVLSPLNLKFVRPAPDGFVNWNLKEPVFTGSGPLAVQFSGIQEPDPHVMRNLLREAAGSMMLCRIYPGFKAERYVSMIEEGTRTFFLELYESGTGNMRDGDYSLKPLLLRGKKHNCRFYCTSQQECRTEFSDYTTSRRVWREGAVPMGLLTTESAVALYYAAALLCDSADELDALMESYAEQYAV